MTNAPQRVLSFLLPSLFILNACTDTQTPDAGSSTSSNSESTGTQSSTATLGSSSTSSDAPTGTTMSPTSTNTSSSGSGSGSGSSSTGSTTCVDLDIGSAIGADVVVSETGGHGNDFDLRDCEDDGNASFVGNREDEHDFVIAWVPPRSGPYYIETTAPQNVIVALVPADCDAEPVECDDACAGTDHGLLIEATAGEPVYLVVEGATIQTDFALSIAIGSEATCEDDGTSSSG